VLALEVGAKCEVFQRVFILVEHRPHLAHVSESIVVLGSEGEFAQIAKGGHSDGVKVPSARKEDQDGAALEGDGEGFTSVRGRGGGDGF
jgi:hypothetical protein